MSEEKHVQHGGIPQRHCGTEKGLTTLMCGDHPVRMILDTDGNPWWVLGDCCAALAIQDVSNAGERLQQDDKRRVPVIDAIGRKQKSYVINESGLWDLTLDSHKTAARAMRHWVTKDVLPSIRQTGGYSIVSDEVLVKGFLGAAFLPWEKRFELEFFQQICRVWGRPIPTTDKHSPWCGMFTRTYVYNLLPAAVLAEMNRRNPMTNRKEGWRSKRVHQLLKEERIKDFLTKRIEQVVAVLASCQAGDKELFKEKIALHDQNRGIEVEIGAGKRIKLRLTMPNQLSLGFKETEEAA